MGNLLNSIEVQVVSLGAGVFPSSDTPCDKFMIHFAKRVKPAKTVSFPFHQGIGHRKNGKPVRPKTEEVLECLLMDASGARNTFREWCSELGYEMDSRRALDTYLACQEIEHQLCQLFGYGYADKLREELGID